MERMENKCLLFQVSKAVENPTNRSSVGVAVFVTNPLEIKVQNTKLYIMKMKICGNSHQILKKCNFRKTDN